MGNGGVEGGDGCYVPWRGAEGLILRAGHRQGMGCQPLGREQRQSHTAGDLAPQDSLQELFLFPGA